ncbi:MAG TPA: DUF4367 domain-containing protein [Candidatus Saccharimonadia bacterium]|nr:DUF4367 domain-containing protein [Candidatus Saccharimonadia bacterium]
MLIGTSYFCRECGARINKDGQPASETPTAPSGRRSMDIRIGRPDAAPPTLEATRTRPQSAAALHARASGGKNVLDLRATGRPATPADAPAPKAAASVTAMAAARAAAIAEPLPHHAQPPAPPPKTTVKHQFRRFEDRFKQAKGVERSHQISRFGRQAHDEETAEEAPATNHHTSPAHELPNEAIAQHQAMSHLAARAAATHTDQPSRPGSHLPPRLGQYVATGVAVMIMGGYIWAQNYPKLAIQSAGNRAGITASLPGYVPSSYQLATTNTAPGLVTLNFTSPSQPSALSIKQSRTSWDSSSLLDNFVAKASAQYTAVEGQGLTIYLYGQNQATWINHGTQYQIEGASRLSREQILKIAYSL